MNAEQIKREEVYLKNKLHELCVRDSQMQYSISDIEKKMQIISRLRQIGSPIPDYLPYKHGNTQ